MAQICPARTPKKHSPLVAVQLVGVTWTAWHAPLFPTQTRDTPRSNVAQVLPCALVVIGLVGDLRWIRIASGSTLAAILAHASVVETTNSCCGLGIIVAAAVFALVRKGRIGDANEMAGSLATSSHPT